MEAVNKLKFWRQFLGSEEAVKRQLSDEYANADTKEDIELLDQIWSLIYGDQQPDLHTLNRNVLNELDKQGIDTGSLDGTTLDIIRKVVEITSKLSINK